MKVGLLHPGEMGSALATHINGDVLWASEGRSAASARRAQSSGLVDCGSIDALVEVSDMILSVCPPVAALRLARSVAGKGFSGLYVDANAIAPATVRKIAVQFDHFVDGGIVGPPPARGAECRLYLSGDRAGDVASIFEAGSVKTVIAGERVGSASALKLAYAGWTKGSSALLLTAAAYATAEGVEEDLIEEWKMSIPDLPERLEALASAIGQKAWRFAGEMDEIAAAYADVDLPDGFHEAAANVYRRLSGLKGVEGDPTTEEVLDLISDADEGRPSN